MLLAWISIARARLNKSPVIPSVYQVFPWFPECHISWPRQHLVIYITLGVILLRLAEKTSIASWLTSPSQSPVAFSFLFLLDLRMQDPWWCAPSLQFPLVALWPLCFFIFSPLVYVSSMLSTCSCCLFVFVWLSNKFLVHPLYENKKKCTLIWIITQICT